MSGTLTRPDWASAVKDLARRVGILERRVTSPTATVDTAHEIIFSYAGLVVAGTTSPPVRLRRSGTLTVLAVTFAVAGSTDTILLIQRNGTTVATVTVPASVTAYNADVFAWYAADTDTLTVEVDTAGTGATDMTAAARFT